MSAPASPTPPSTVARGLWFMVGSAAAFSLMSALVKLASRTVPTAEIVLARAVVTLALSWLMVRRIGRSPWGQDRRRLAMRGAFGFTALACYYWTLGRLPLAEATTVHNTAPIWSALLAWWLLRERVARSTAFGLALGLAGVVLVARPWSAGRPEGLAESLAVLVALAAALTSAAAYVTVRHLARTEHPLVIVFYFPLVALPASLVWALPGWVTPTWSDALVLLGVGVTTQIGQVCLTYGLANAPTARAMAVGYLQVAFAVGWGLLAFDETPGLTTILGALAVVGGTAVTAAVGSARAAATAAARGR